MSYADTWGFALSLAEDMTTKFAEEWMRKNCCFEGLLDIDILLLVWSALSLRMIENLLLSPPPRGELEKLLLMHNDHILRVVYGADETQH